MTNSGKSKPWEDMDTSEIALNGSDVAKEPRPEQMQTQMGDSDDEYQSIGRSAKRKQVERAAVTPADEGGSPHKHTEADDKPAGEDFSGVEKSSNEPEKGPNNEGDGNPPTAVSDSDWLRSRTSRLLGLLDEDEEETHRSRGPKGEEDQEKGARKAPPVEDVLSENLPRDSSPPAVDNDEEAPAKGDVSKPMDADESAIRESSRLFLRNLPFNATEDDLRAHLAAYGQIEEVS